MRSQNVLFLGDSPGDDPYEPPGAGLTNQIAEALRQDGYAVGEIDNWRDCGWSIDLQVGQAALQIALGSTLRPREWILQVACINQPGLLRRLFGAKRFDCSQELVDVASAVHRALIAAGCSELRWRIDGFPSERHFSPEPSAAER